MLRGNLQKVEDTLNQKNQNIKRVSYKLKIKQYVLRDGHITHFIDEAGEPFCGDAASDEGEHQLCMDKIQSTTISCEYCIKRIKWIKSI